MNTTREDDIDLIKHMRDQFSMLSADERQRIRAGTQEKIQQGLLERLFEEPAVESENNSGSPATKVKNNAPNNPANTDDKTGYTLRDVNEIDHPLKMVEGDTNSAQAESVSKSNEHFFLIPHAIFGELVGEFESILYRLRYQVDDQDNFIMTNQDQINQLTALIQRIINKGCQLLDSNNQIHPEVIKMFGWQDLAHRLTPESIVSAYVSYVLVDISTFLQADINKRAMEDPNAYIAMTKFINKNKQPWVIERLKPTISDQVGSFFGSLFNRGKTATPAQTSQPTAYRPAETKKTSPGKDHSK